MKTIVLVLKEGKDFSFKDVELLTRHIIGKWEFKELPRIILLWDKASQSYDLGSIKIVPLTNNLPGTWSRMQLYSPEMEQYRPFLYLDLDTVVNQSVEKIFDLVKDESQFITLEDFWQKGQLATGVVWFPAKSEKIRLVWETFNKGNITLGFRMDYFLRKVIQPLIYWQHFTDKILDFKPKPHSYLNDIPAESILICFHGHPRIFEANTIKWVNNYINQDFKSKNDVVPLVTIIIPYKEDRGWLQDAINSVPNDPTVQLIVSQGEGNWPANFNKALPQARGKYIKFLHEDDMLTPNCIRDSVGCFKETGADFIHGNAIELNQETGIKKYYFPNKLFPTVNELIEKNVFHSATLMYKREVFNIVGTFDESLNTQEEFEFNLRCLKAGMKVGYANTELVIYRRHPKQKVRTVSTEDKQREKQQVVQDYL
jgi:hypothetical protein